MLSTLKLLQYADVFGVGYEDVGTLRPVALVQILQSIPHYLNSGQLATTICRIKPVERFHALDSKIKLSLGPLPTECARVRSQQPSFSQFDDLRLIAPHCNPVLT